MVRLGKLNVEVDYSNVCVQDSLETNGNPHCAALLEASRLCHCALCHLLCGCLHSELISFSTICRGRISRIPPPAANW